VSITVTLDKDKFRVTVTEERGRKPSALRGDTDNYIKSIMDGLNGAAYVDDKQVYKITVTKK
jgi:Holliday junction resolvase RusA-like endonuclease